MAIIEEIKGNDEGIHITSPDVVIYGKKSGKEELTVMNDKEEKELSFEQVEWGEKTFKEFLDTDKLVNQNQEGDNAEGIEIDFEE